MLADVLVLALALAASVAGASSGRKACMQNCDTERDAALVQACDGCATSVLDERHTCMQTALDQYKSCVAACPAFAGRCAITRTCVNRCRADITVAREKCQRMLQSHLRRRCAGGRACLVTANAARQQCRSGCAAGEATPVSPAVPDRCACQERCIDGLIGDCYADCDDRCEGDQTSLGICRRGCRDAACGPLEGMCTARKNRPGSEYQRCCNACGNCQDDVDCQTTTTLATTTTSGPTSTTSTTVPTTSCATLGASCGSCGSGVCVQQCVAGGRLVCIMANAGSIACANDAGCPALTICAGIQGNPASCTTAGLGTCSATCN